MSQSLKKWLLKNKMYLIGAIVGAIAGFLYWRLIGCSSGSCAITSSPVNSSIYFSIVGLLIAGTFKSTKETDAEKDSE